MKLTKSCSCFVHTQQSSLQKRMLSSPYIPFIKSAKVARLLCQIIPIQCPFEHDIKLFDHTIFHILPLCKLNPFYEQVVNLRFVCLSYLADECGEDVTVYCQERKYTLSYSKLIVTRGPLLILN